jgi:hypothetical protein
MEDGIQAASLATDRLDEGLETFRALCFELVGICRAIQSPEMRVRALVKTETAFVDCLAGLWKESALGPRVGREAAPGQSLGVLAAIRLTEVTPDWSGITGLIAQPSSGTQDASPYPGVRGYPETPLGIEALQVGRQARSVVGWVYRSSWEVCSWLSWKPGKHRWLIGRL